MATRKAKAKVKAKAKPAAKKAVKKAAAKKAVAKKPVKSAAKRPAVKSVAKPAAKKPAPQNGVAGLPPPSTAPFGAAGKLRRAGIARFVSGSSSSNMESAGFMVAMMLVPDGGTAAESASSVIW